MELKIERIATGHQYIGILDGFRGLAIMLVIAMHYTNFTAGWIGVDLFFVLSGFLITWKLVQNIDKPSYYRNFYWRRILRICPLYVATLIFVFYLFPLLKPSLVTSSYRDLQGLQVWYWTFSQNFYNASHGWPDNISIVHFWSLATEMQFYLIWPLVIKLFNKKVLRIMGILLLLVCIAVLFRWVTISFTTIVPLYRYVLLPSRIDAFALGSLLFFYLQRDVDRARQFLLYIGLAGVIVNVILYTCFFSVHYSAWFTSHFGYTLFDITWAGIIGYGLLAPEHSVIKRIFTNKFIQATGKYSYAMYIFHLPVWTIINRLLVNRYGEQFKHGAAMLMLSLAVFITVYLLAFLSYHGFEKYFLRLKKAFA